MDSCRNGSPSNGEYQVIVSQTKSTIEGESVKIIALEREIPGIEVDAFDPHRQSETRKVWELYQAGIIRELYFRNDRREAVFILECDDVGTARKHLGTLPFVKAGLIIFDLIPVKPYPGFARLFRSPDKE